MEVTFCIKKHNKQGNFSLNWYSKYQESTEQNIAVQIIPQKSSHEVNAVVRVPIKSSQEQNVAVPVPRKGSRETNTAVTTASHMDLDSIDVDCSQPEVSVV